LRIPWIRLRLAAPRRPPQGGPRDRLVRLERYPNATAATPTETVSYAYGPLGRRWSRTRAGTTQRFLYDGLDRIAALDPSGALLEWVTFGPGIDEPLGREDATGRRLWYRASHQASVMALEDGSATTDTYRYSPYGITTAAGTTPNDFRHTGREYEAEDLYYYRARYYDPTVGRFLSEDPFLRGAQLPTLSLYSYIENSPTNGTDPTGELAWFIAPILGGMIGGGADLLLQLALNDGNWQCVDWTSVLISAGLGALSASTGPSGWLFGARSRVTREFGWPGGIFNRGMHRLGWSWNQRTGRFQFGYHWGVPRTPSHGHFTPIPGPRSGAELGFGIGGGLAGGAAGAALNDNVTCFCQ